MQESDPKKLVRVLLNLQTNPSDLLSKSARQVNWMTNLLSISSPKTSLKDKLLATLKGTFVKIGMISAENTVGVVGGLSKPDTPYLMRPAVLLHHKHSTGGPPEGSWWKATTEEACHL